MPWARVDQDRSFVYKNGLLLVFNAKENIPCLLTVFLWSIRTSSLAIKVYKLIINEPLPNLSRFMEPVPLDQVRVLITVFRRCYAFGMAVADVLVCGEEPMLTFFFIAVPSHQLVAVIRPVATAGQTLSMSIHQSP